MTSESEIEIDIESMRRIAKREANEIHSAALKTLTGDASIEERDTWPRKAPAAEAFLKGQADAAQIVILEGAAARKGVSIQEVAQLIKINSVITDALIGYADGMLGQAMALINNTEPENMGQAMQQIRAAEKEAIEQAKANRALIEACAQVLAEGDPEKLTTDNKPTCEALSETLGRRVNVNERDSAVTLLRG